jgi:hypothetical protein
MFFEKCIGKQMVRTLLPVSKPFQANWGGRGQQAPLSHSVLLLYIKIVS